jgi:membrane fusion protein (multidrug efflux system)
MVSNDPIYVTFPVSARIILDVRQQAIKAGKPAEFVVRAQLPDGTMYGHPGKVNFLNIEVDQTTDTITVRAQFPNPEGLLVDGQFVNVSVERDKPEERLVVPQTALQLDQSGSYVLVVNPQDEVEQQPIQTGQAYQGNLVVESGLQAGDRVIVEGIQKVRPGQKVQVSVVQLPTISPQSIQPQPAEPDSGGRQSSEAQSATPGVSPAQAAEPPSAGGTPAGAGADGTPPPASPAPAPQTNQ